MRGTPQDETSYIPVAAFDLSVVSPGEKFAGWLDMGSHLVEGVRLPIMVVRGAKTGPTVLVTAGVHGDEFEGMEAIRLFLDDVDPRELNGALVGLPICNPMAYQGMSRCTPAHIDGLNLARMFPGRSDGTPTERLAYQLLHLVLRTLTPKDLLIDLHSGTAECEFASMVGYRDFQDDSSRRAEQAARRFGFSRVWRLGATGETLNGAVAHAGVPAVGAEVTGRGGCRPDDVRRYVHGIRSLARFWGLLPGEPEVPATGPARRTTAVTAQASGFFRALGPDLGEPVARGAVLGDIVDPFGRSLASVMAPIAGEIWAMRRFPAVWAGGLLAMIGEEDPSGIV